MMKGVFLICSGRSKKILVEQDNYYEKELMTTLSTLSKYTGFRLERVILVNPFLT